MDINKFISIIRDEKVTILHHLMQLAQVDKDYHEEVIEDISNDQRVKKCLAMAHLHFSRLGFSLTDDERHLIFSRIFGRNITSAKQLTNVEAMALANSLNPENDGFSKKMIKDILNEGRSAGRI